MVKKPVVKGGVLSMRDPALPKLRQSRNHAEMLKRHSYLHEYMRAEQMRFAAKKRGL